MRWARRVRFRRTLVAMAVLGMAISIWPVVARAEQGTPHSSAALEEAAKRRKAILDALFAELGEARDQATADPIVARIWEYWMLSGRDDVDVLMSKVAASMAGRHFGLALLLVEEVIALAPDFAEGWNKRATLHYHMGQYEPALADIERTLALEPRHFGALAGRAAIHAEARRWNEALAAYRAALAINPFLAQRDRVLRMLKRRVGEQGL